MALEAAELRRIWTNAGEEGSNPGSVTARRAALAALPETLPFSDRIGISRETVFFATKLSIAFVNISPLVPGHVLVVPRRVEPRLLGLDADERADLWRSVRAVEAVLGVWRSERALEKATHVSRGARTARQRRKGFDSEAATVGDGSSRERGELGGESGQRGGTRPEDVTYRIGVQDGAVAGQTVPHVHVHILPMLP
jgi:bis(5'-adenosyl)-triphosphatase